MATLYLVHQTCGQVMTFTEAGDNTWHMTRLPSQQAAKVHIIMSFGRHGWHIKEGGVKIQASTLLAEQDPRVPPLGAWEGVSSGIAWTGHWTLQAEKPELPALEMISMASKSFTLETLTLEDHVVRVDLRMHREALSDQDVENCIETIRHGVKELAMRPEYTLLFSFQLQDAAIPAMRHVKRLVALSHEIGHLLFLVARGSAIILRPHGFLGAAMVAIVRFVQSHAAAPWPETIVRSMAEANDFLLAQRPSRLSHSARDISNAAELVLETPSNVAKPEPVLAEAAKARRARSKSTQEEGFQVDLWVPTERETIQDVAELEIPHPASRTRSLLSLRRWWLCLECS